MSSVKGFLSYIFLKMFTQNADLFLTSALWNLMKHYLLLLEWLEFFHAHKQAYKLSSAL